MSQRSKKLNANSTSQPDSRFSPSAVVVRGEYYNEVVDDITELYSISAVPGPVGPQGPIGPQGPVGPVGPVGLTWQGAWSALTAYVANDAVSFGGSSYYAINPVGPSASNPSIDVVNWSLLALQGAQGAQGPQGLPGAGLESGENYYFVFASSDPITNSTELVNTYNTAKLSTPNGFPIGPSNQVTIIVGAGLYEFNGSDFILDTPYVNVVSLGGSTEVQISGINTIHIQASPVYVKGITVGASKIFKIDDNLTGLIVENCRGGNESFGGDSTGLSPLIVPGTFINCSGGTWSFGGGGTASGTFTNCTASNFSFGYLGTASGSFTECTGGTRSFGSFGSANGTFYNCLGGQDSYGGGGTLTGTVFFCRISPLGGLFPVVSAPGRVYYSIDGNGNVNNQ